MTAKNPKNAKPKLSDEQKALLARKAGGASGTGWQSIGSNHKPTQASGKQAPAQRKVRW